MFQGRVGSGRIVDDDGADLVGLELAAHGGGWNVAFFQVGEHVDVHEQPVGQDDQSLDAAVKEHFQVALEAAALVVHVGEDGQERGLVESVLDSRSTRVQ